MTKLSGTLTTIEAHAYAREEFERYRNNRIHLFGIEIALLDDSVDETGVRCLMMKATRSATDMMDVVDYARAGWDLAYMACQNLILEFENNRVTKPDYLTAYNMELIRNGPPPLIRGQTNHTHFWRDICICCVIWKTCMKFHLKPTRGAYSTKVSGCSIVAQVLNMAEPTVAGIWQQYGRLNLPVNSRHDFKDLA